MLPRVAILALREATASVVYGMLDIFCSAGRDWRLVTDGVPGQARVLAEVVAKSTAGLQVANGAWVQPQRAFSRQPYDIVCVPELAIAPGSDLTGRFAEEIAWIVQQQKAAGVTALEYVHALRLEDAKTLLETTEQPLHELAEKVGYDDATFFSRLFRRKVGLTPADYRRRFGALRGALGRR